MEGRSAQPDMISMSRSSRDFRASKNPRVSSETTSNPPPAFKKSQIRGSGSPRATPSSKKTKTAIESPAGASNASKKPETGSARGESSNYSSRPVSKSKREADNGGDVTLDAALRPAKKQKIRGEAVSGPSPKSEQAKSLKSGGENGKLTAPTSKSPEDSTLNYASKILKNGPGSASINSDSEEVNASGRSARQIGSRVAGTPNGPGLSEAAKRKEQRALRPRPKTTAPKVKKRTRFHDVTLGEGDGPRIVGRRIKVFWPLENKFFYGHVKAFDGERRGQHKIVYDDKDEEWLRLQDEVFGIELVPEEVFGGTTSAPAAETSTAAHEPKSISEDSSEHRGDIADGDISTLSDTKIDEVATKGRIKPEGVYRRKRKAERASEKKQLEGSDEQEKNAEGDVVPNKTDGRREEKRIFEGKNGIRKKRGAKEGGSSAQSLGRGNVKRVSGNSGVSERRNKGVDLVTPRGASDRRGKGMTADVSSDRRKRLGKKDVTRKGSSVQTRNRHSNLGVKEGKGKKSQKNRIRDDDRLFSSVKSSSTVIRRKVSEVKRDHFARLVDKRHAFSPFSHTQNGGMNSVDGEKLTKISPGIISEQIQADPEFPLSSDQRANAEVLHAPLAPFEAVVDAYLEALSGNKAPPNVIANEAAVPREPDEVSSLAAGSEDQGVIASDPLDLQDHVGEDLRQSHDPGSRLLGGASRGVQLTDWGNGSPTAVQVNADRQSARNEVENDSSSREESIADDHRVMRETSTTEVVLTPPIPPVIRLRPELKELPDKVYRRLKKYQAEKVYCRLKHSRNRVQNNGVDEQADEPHSVVPVPRYWFLAKALPSASHVLSSGARIAALGFFLPSFNRIAFPRLQCRSRTEDGLLQLGSFYGAPSIQSLLRVSWNSLQWLLTAMTVPVSTVDDTRVGDLRVSVKSAWKSKLHLRTTSRRFKGRGMSRRYVHRSLTLFSHLTDPISGLKCLSLNTAYLRGVGRRSSSFDPVRRFNSSLVGAPQAPGLGPQELQIVSSTQLAPPHGQIMGGLYSGERVLYFNVLKQALFFSDPWISRQRATSSAVNVLLNRARSMVTFPIAPVSSWSRQTMSCTEVGAYYGMCSLESLLRVTRDVTSRMDVGAMTFSQSGGSLDHVNVRNILREIAHMYAAVGDGSNSSHVGLMSTELCEENALSSILFSRYEAGIVESEQFTAATRRHRSPVMPAWPNDGLVSHFEPRGSDLTPTRYGRTVPITIHNRYLPIFSSIAYFTTPGLECSMPSREVTSPEVVALEGLPLHAEGLATISRIQAMHVVVGRECDAGPVFETAGSSLSDVQPCGFDTDCRQVGMHYGPPGVESLLRVSKDLHTRLLVEQLQVEEPINNLPVTSTLVNNVESGTFPRTECNEFSSIETIDDDEQSDQEDRMQVTSGEVATVASNSFVSEEGSNLFGADCKAPSGSGLPMKKGRRTGKGVKRGFVQVIGDSFCGDGLGADSDLLSSKRARVEIESSGTAANKDNGVESSPHSDLEGKAFTTLPEQEKGKASLPRVNVLKLRRCPTNKGRWLVAGNSCATPQEREIRGTGIEAESSVPVNSGEFGEGGEPMTPIFETSRKRVLEHCQEYVQPGRNDSTRAAAVADTLTNTVCNPGSNDLETTASVIKSTKTYSLNSKSKEVWFDCGITSINGGVPDGLETRKRRRKSSIHGNDVDGISEHSSRRSDHGWGSCSANVLITKGDRCVRETGAMVELQTRHGNSCMLTVSLHGESKYALKADQPVASGTTNKFTHSMMWRGGKAWSLEFVERKQWQVFKDLHEECFQRNARAASVRHIPIPGVKPIQECPKLGLRFSRPSAKYIHQFDGEVEMALSSTRIIYDMDSEDEEWLNHINSEKVSARGTRSRPKIDDDTLERVMDKLEKSSFIQQQDPMSAEVAGELCQTLASQDVIRAIHGHWYGKRERKGMALVRHFQPPPWEQYQNQLQNWQAKVDLLQQQSPTASKQHLQSLCKRPPLFAFCLRPRGLETRNKMQKQRSQRKQGLSGSSSRPWTLGGPSSDFFLDSPSKRHAGFDSTSGPFCGSRKYVRHRIHEDGYLDQMPVDLTDSFNNLASEGFASVGSAGQVIPGESGVSSPPIESSSVIQFEASISRGVKRTKKLGRKAKKMKLLAAAEESRRKRQLRTQHLKGGFVDTMISPLPEIVQDLGGADPSTSGGPPPEVDSTEEKRIAHAKAMQVIAKAKRDTATALRARAQALYAVADAAMHKAVAAVIAADKIHAAEREAEAVEREQEPAQPVTHRQHTGEVPVAVKDDVSRLWGRSEASGGPSFGSWRRALNSASKNVNFMLPKGSSSKPVPIVDMDDALLPVASWSQELGAGLGTRLLQTGEVSPQIQRYSPVLVEGLSKSPTRVRGEGLVSLGRTRGESMMAMLTR